MLITISFDIRFSFFLLLVFLKQWGMGWSKKKKIKLKLKYITVGFLF